MPILFRSPLVAWLGAVSAGVLLILSLSPDPVSAAPPAKTLPRASKYPFAGYLTSPTTITSASATITLPSLSCARKTQALAAGAIVYSSTGSHFSSADVYIGCSSRKEILAALTDVNNHFKVPTVTMNPGDIVSLSATCGPSGISVTVDDETSMSTATNSSSAPETCTQAEIGDDAAAKDIDAGTGIVPLPDFGSLTFTNAMVNGAALGSVPSSATTYSEGKKNMITTGPLTGGTAFTTTQEA
jgi:hypothetical protein